MKGTKNADLNIEGFLNTHAPMRARPGVVEYYRTDGLAARLGVEHDDVAAILEAGLLKPKTALQKSQHGEMAGFDGSDLDRIRRGAIISALEMLGIQNPEFDDHDIAALAGAKRAFSRRDASNVVELSAATRTRIHSAFGQALRGEIRFATKNADAVLLAAGSRMIGIEFDAAPLNGKLARDRYVKKIQDDDQTRRDANVGRAAVAGAAAGSLFPIGKLKLPARAALGAGAGVAGVLGIRRVTAGTRDQYGERSRPGKQAEALPTAVGATAALGGAALAIKKLLAARRGKLFSRQQADVIFDALSEQGGPDMRIEFGATAYRNEVIEFALGGLGAVSPLIAGLLRGSRTLGRNIALPGTTANTAVKAAAIGAGAGGVQAAADGDDDTSIAGGIFRGAGAGVAIGTGASAARSMSPEMKARVAEYFARRNSVHR